MIVTVDVPELPCETVMLVADNAKLLVEEVPLVPPTSTVTVPVEDANFESPEYFAVMTCAPDVDDEKVYVAEPLDNASEELCVVPSAVTVRVPVGVVVIELDSGETVIVIVSLAPDDGVLLAADRDVVVASRDAELPPVQEVIRL